MVCRENPHLRSEKFIFEGLGRHRNPHLRRQKEPALNLDRVVIRSLLNATIVDPNLFLLFGRLYIFNTRFPDMQLFSRNVGGYSRNFIQSKAVRQIAIELHWKDVAGASPRMF